MHGAATQDPSRLGGNGYSNAAHSPKTLRDASPVECAQKSLDAATNSLHQTITELEDRLTSVLAQVPSNPSSTDVPAPHSAASRIDGSASSVSYACARLQELINRLEV